jgi:hypothetical protein
MTEIYAKGQKESFQQQKQQSSEDKVLDILNNIQPPITHHSQQDVEEANVPLLHLPSSNDTVTTPTQTVFQLHKYNAKKVNKLFNNFNMYVYFAFYTVILYLGRGEVRAHHTITASPRRHRLVPLPTTSTNCPRHVLHISASPQSGMDPFHCYHSSRVPL